MALVLIFAHVLSVNRKGSQPPTPVPSPSPTYTSFNEGSPSPPTPFTITTQPPTPTVTPASPTAPTTAAPTSGWTQDAGNAQRTGYSTSVPTEPWSLAWTWNGPDSSGGLAGHFYNAPPKAHTIIGGQDLVAPAGTNGLYAIHLSDGSQAWHLTSPAFNATPAYDPSNADLFAGGADGKVYKIDANSGTVLGTYSAASPVNQPLLLANGFVYAVSDDGNLHKISEATMTAAWVYSANSPAATPPSYSAAYQTIVYATQDLFVQAVNDQDGSQKWHVKPTVNPAQAPYSFDGYWPVIAEKHGLVFLRLNLGMPGLWATPQNGKPYPSSNAATRVFLQQNPNLQNLFALSLQNGQPAFIPAVGFGGVEALDSNGQPILEMGPPPLIKVEPDGSEVAYVIFRSGQGNPQDGRWDSHLGEMVLDDNTIPGMVAGDVRFVNFPNSYIKITDEQTPLTMSGDTIFHAHWAASESISITDRSNNLGQNINNPIQTQAHPPVIRRLAQCSDFNPSTHWANCENLSLYGDSRTWTGPGWWVYWNRLDPTTPNRPAYSQGLLPRYTYASGGYIVVEGNGGSLFVMHYATQ